MTEIYEVSYEIFLLREIFNICLICALVVFGSFLFLKMRQKEKESTQRSIMLGYTLFLFAYALTRTFFVLSDIEIWNTGNPETYLNNVYVGIAYSLGILGAFFIIYLLERFFIHSKFIFTVLAIMILIVSIISIFSLIPSNIPQLIVTIALPGFFLVILLLYLYVAIKSPGDARRRALGIVAGILIIMIGLLFGSSLMGNILDPLGLYTIRILVEPFIVIAGGAVFTLSQR